MDQLLAALPYLACPIGMGLMMWMMSRRGNAGGTTAASAPLAATDGEAAALRAELTRVQAEQERIARDIETLERSPAARNT